MPPAETPPRAAVAAGLVLALAVGLWPYLDRARIPGDLGDNRFNMVILEHGYAWLTGRAPSFWSAPFFHPAPQVVAYSDNHLGNLPAYAALRLTGLSREDAFQAWMVLACLLNFSVCYLVLRRLGGGAAGSLAGAFLFAFGLPSSHQVTHAQLLPRFFVPVAFLALFEYWRAPRSRLLVLGLAALVGQLYCGVYLGFFLTGCLALLAVILIARSGDVPAALKALTGWPGRTPGRLALFALACAALLPIALPYAEAGAVLGMWPPSETAAMTPRPASWLNAPLSPFWSWLGRFARDLPVPQEHALFVGLVPLAALAALPVLARREPSPDNDRPLAMLWLAAIAAASTLHVFGGSLYGLVAPHVPGLGAIRSVARIVLVLLFPLAVVLCRVVDRLADTARTPSGRTAALFAGLALLLADQAAVGLPSFSKAEALGRVAAVKASLGPVTPDRVLFYAPEGPGRDQAFVSHLDAMLAAQDLGIATVNGFSGHAPPGYPAALDALSGDVCRGLRLWLCRNGGLGLYGPLVQPAARCRAPADAAPDWVGSPTIDFRQECLPPAVALVTGLWSPEPLGRWTAAELAPAARIEFSRPLPREFTLEIAATAFGPNAGKPVRVAVGDLERSFVLDRAGEYVVVRLRFKLDKPARAVTLTPPEPKSPKSLGLGADTRRLGISLRTLRIVAE